MIAAIETILGQYVQLAGDGIASLNLEWIVGALVFLMVLWFTFKVCLCFFRWVLGVKQ